MANTDICVFCGEKLGFLSSSGVRCGDVFQQSCRNCAKEMEALSEEEQCRRALRLGLANQPEKLEERIELCQQAEEHRPACLHCGTGLVFEEVQILDNSPLHDGIFSTTFDVLPAHCPSCGKYEVYKPEIAKRNRFFAHLIRKDTTSYPSARSE